MVWIGVPSRNLSILELSDHHGTTGTLEGPTLGLSSLSQEKSDHGGE